MQITRREFLIAGGVSAAAAARVFSLPQFVLAGADGGQSTPIERTRMTLCRQCPGGCGLRIRVVNDQVVGIAGNPVHPVNHGGVCARAPAAVQTLYNPDRITRPMILSGPKGSGAYRPIGWTDAIELLGARMREARALPGPQSVAVVLNGDRGLSRMLWSRFLQAYGSNNLIDWSGPESHQAHAALKAMQGFGNAVGYDLARTKYVLSFNSQWLDAHWSPAQASEAFAEMRSADPAFRPRFVSIEPRLSLTGAKADEWVPIVPGTEGALALGIAHVLIREGLYDREFVENLTHGFEDPADASGNERIGFFRLVLRDYAPTKVARVTGVSEETIFRLAREFSANRPSLAIGFDGSGVSQQRAYDRMAIHALNALVGSIDVPGGVTHFQSLDLINDPMPDPDDIAAAGLAKPRIDQTETTMYPLGERPIRQIAEHILAEWPYAVEVLVLAGVDPVFDGPYPARMREALAKVPFVVSLSPWLDDSARWADLIIPETHFLSRWDIDVSHTLAGQPVVSIAQPVVAAPKGGLSSAEVILRLARDISEQTAAALPYENAELVVRRICNALGASGRGAPFGPGEEVAWTQLMERSGWQHAEADDADDFYRRVVAAGGWSDPIYYHRQWDRVFRSPPRRFAFHSAVVAQRIGPRTIAQDIRCLPHHETIRDGEPDETFPLRLYVYPLPVLAGMTDANVPWLVVRAGAVMGQRWRTWIELNPATARKLHLHDGDRVVVSSPRGNQRTVVKTFEGVMPGVAAMPWGLGHHAGGRWCAGVGQNPSTLVDVQTDPLTAGPVWTATRIAIRKA